jgi:hypothetical protein
MATDQNLGDLCLKAIASTWLVDDAAMKTVDGGFDWSPGSHLVRVRAQKHPSEDRWRVSVETNFLTSVPIEDTKFIELTAMTSVVGTSPYAMQYPPAALWKRASLEESPKLTLFSSVYVSRELARWLPAFFAAEALVQVTNAEILSAITAETVGGNPDFLPSGKNLNPDGILEVLNDIYALEGAKPSRWNDIDEFIEVAEKYGRSDACFGMGDRSALTLETPFGSDSALIQLLSDVQHPQLGSGLLVTVQLPFLRSAADIAQEAAFLNFWEAREWTNFPQLGRWQPHHVAEGKIRLAHTSFVPNVLYRPGLATNFAIWSIARASWVRHERWPELEDRPMIEILKKRMGDVS